MLLKDQIEKYIPYNEQEEIDKRLMLQYIDNFEDVITRKNTLCHFTASSWIVNKDRTKVLMIYHNQYNSWAWTGGHVDGDINLLKVALKEAKEETGLENIEVLNKSLYSLEILTVDGHIKRGKYVSSHLHLNGTFLFEADENSEIRIKADENSAVKWFPIEEVVDASSEINMKKIYIKLNEKLKDTNYNTNI